MTTQQLDLGQVKAAKVVDARGSACPGPLLEAKKGVGAIKVGEVLEIWSGDLRTFERGIDAIPVMYSGTDCPYKGGAERTAEIVNRTYPLLKEKRIDPAACAWLPSAPCVPARSSKRCSR